MINFEDLYKKKITKILEQIIELNIIPEPKYLESEEYKYFKEIKTHYSLTCLLYLADEKKLKDEFIDILKPLLKDAFDDFIIHYKDLICFIEEFWNNNQDLIAPKKKYLHKIDLINYCYNLTFYKEYKIIDNSSFLEAILNGTLITIKHIFNDHI